jgi:hypothetical protein
MWSTLYIISRFVSAISMERYIGAVVFGVVALGAVYSAIASFMCFAVMIIDKYIADTYMQASAKRMLNFMNTTLISIAGVDKDNTEGGKIRTTNIDEKRHQELVSRLDSLESELADISTWGHGSGDELDDYDVCDDEADDLKGSGYFLAGQFAME